MMISYRLTVCDHYLSPPIRGLDVTYSEFRGTEVKQVPIIRIFGSTLDGKKACVHVHGVFPYIYIPYEGPEPAETLKYLIASGLDKAINISLGQTNSLIQHVFKIILVSGIPFYGYHEKEHQFLKIYFFNPHMVKRAAELLQNGAVQGRVFQPHEAHVPFALQFMVDYNLQGMNLVNCAQVAHRRDQPEWEVELFGERVREAPLKISCCEEEVDVAAVDIVNIRDSLSQSTVNPGLAGLWQDEEQRRREQGRPSQPTPQSSQPRGSVPSTSEVFFREKLRERLENLSQNSDESFSTQLTGGSTYPLEAPEGSLLLNASFVDPHTPRKTAETAVSPAPEEEDTGSQSQLMDTQDLDVLDILGQLAASHDEDGHSIVGSQEPDSPLLDQAEMDLEADERESLEMSQPIFPLSASPTPSLPPANPQEGGEVRLSQGMINNGDSSDESLADDLENIPQFDGADDPPCSSAGGKTKGRRLGARGPLTRTLPLSQSSQNSSNSQNSSDKTSQELQINSISSSISNESQNSQTENLCIDSNQAPKNSSTDISFIYELLESQNLAQNPQPSGSKQEILQFLQSPDIPSTSKTMEGALGSTELVSRLCNSLEWSAGGETIANEVADGINISDLYLPEGTAALQLLEEEMSPKATKKQSKEKRSKLSLRSQKRDASNSKSTVSTDDMAETIASKPSVTINLHQRNHAKNVVRLVPENNVDTLGECHATWSSNVLKRRGRPSLDKNEAKKQRFSLELEVPMNKKSVINVEINPNSAATKKMKISYAVEDCPPKEPPKRRNRKKNMTPKMKDCYVRLERLSSEIIGRYLNNQSDDLSNFNSTSQTVDLSPVYKKPKKSKKKKCSSPPKHYTASLVPKDPFGKRCTVVLKKTRAIDLLSQTSKSSQTIETSSSETSQKSEKTSQENNLRTSTPQESNISPSKRLKSKLKSVSSLSSSSKKVSFSPLHVILNKSPEKRAGSIDDDNKSTSPEDKNAPRRKLNYPSPNSTEMSDLEPSAIESDVDFVEDSEDDNSTLSKTSVVMSPKKSATPTTNTSLDTWEEKQEELLPSPPEMHIESQVRGKRKFKSKNTVPAKISDSSGDMWDEVRVDPVESSPDQHIESQKQSKNYCGPIKKEPDRNLYSIMEEDEEGITSFYDISETQIETPRAFHTSIFISSPGISSQDNFEPIYNPPSYKEVLETLEENKLREFKFQEPYYSLPTDVEPKSKEIGGRVMKILSHSARDLPEFQSIFTENKIKFKSTRLLNNIIFIEPLFLAPTYEEICNFKEKEKKSSGEISKLRIQVPNSPERDCSDDESLSLSPCSESSRPWTPISPSPASQKYTSNNSKNTPNDHKNTPNDQKYAPNDHKNTPNDQKITPNDQKNALNGQKNAPNDQKNVLNIQKSTPMARALAKVIGTPRRLSSQSDTCCRIDGPSPLNNTFGFRVDLENLQDARALVQPQQLTVLCLELHVSTRGDLRPDPDTDPVCAAFYLACRDDGLGSRELGLIAVETKQLINKRGCVMRKVEDEKQLMREVLEVVRRWDPDILMGYEIEMESWGYLIQRASHLDLNLVNLLGRVVKPERANQESANHNAASQGAITEVNDLRITGRIVLNLWRLMKHEVSLQSYVFENLVYHVLHERVSRHSHRQLTHWWDHPSGRYRWLVIDYFLFRVEGCSRLLDQLDLLGRTSELAKLFGIQFYEVLSRGSQFRVESMMLRLAKPRNFVPVSPSIVQRAHMRSPEFIPLVMEPESRYYEDPVIVLDFQSLYPSIIIAYNYCFSTCLGRVEHLGQEAPFEFGCTQLLVPPKLLRKLSSEANISPCGAAFVKPETREGVLPRMLREILDTRLMVKKSMKENRGDSTLQRVLHARQLGLKLIANVTYGYTAANFSGRMPCAEVADSVVSKGRETLDRAIRLVKSRVGDWGAEVVYGDTDSMFVLVRSRTRQQAFKIGAEIAEAVTADNPTPVKLKLEKVYQPCILQTKKRYVGYMYESADQETPTYEAKGIETVRRDGCPAVAKMLEKCLRLLFESQDVSLVKQYVTRQFQKLLLGRTTLQDLVFAKEFRGFSGYKPGACVPALELTRQWLRVDRRAEPRRGERVPYVVVSGAPGLPLIRLVRSPLDLLKEPSLRINAEYYITRAIAPALDRCLSLLGADVKQWYLEMPRRTSAPLPSCPTSGATTSRKGTISQYFATVECAACREQTREGLCVACQERPQKAALVLSEKLRRWERHAGNVAKVCDSCCGRPFDTECCSLVCPVLFRRSQAERDLQQAPFVRGLFAKFLDF